MKVRVRMLLDVTRDFSEAEVLDLYPAAALQEVTGVVQAEEEMNLRVDPAQYAAVLLAQGADVKMKVEFPG